MKIDKDKETMDIVNEEIKEHRREKRMKEKNLNKLTRRESALYTLGAYEMLLVNHKDNGEAQTYYMNAILDFMRAYLPEYSQEDMEQLFKTCQKEKETGTCRKLFDKRVKEVNK